MAMSVARHFLLVDRIASATTYPLICTVVSQTCVAAAVRNDSLPWHACVEMCSVLHGLHFEPSSQTSLPACSRLINMQRPSRCDCDGALPHPPSSKASCLIMRCQPIVVKFPCEWGVAATHHTSEPHINFMILTQKMHDECLHM